jgi:hypothetical protein
MDEAKPFNIPKRVVWKAFKRVEANRGSAGVVGRHEELAPHIASPANVTGGVPIGIEVAPADWPPRLRQRSGICRRGP